MSILTDKGNRWVGVHCKQKCTNCYLYGTECLSCEGSNCGYTLMSFNEFKKLSLIDHATLTYDEFKTTTYDDYFRHFASIDELKTLHPDSEGDTLLEKDV